MPFLLALFVEDDIVVMRGEFHLGTLEASLRQHRILTLKDRPRFFIIFLRDHFGFSFLNFGLRYFQLFLGLFETVHFASVVILADERPEGMVLMYLACYLFLWCSIVIKINRQKVIKL